MSFATKVMGGSTSNKTDSAGRRLGLKKWGHTTEIFEGDILARQRGTKWKPGMNVAIGKDHTLHSKVEGSLAWTRDRFYIKRRRRSVHVVPMELPNKRFPSPPPFMFHPELQPDLASRNVKNFVPFDVPKSKYRRNRDP